ncbi:MAG: carbon starvation protein A [Candidatus Hydrogenedentota bacterium]|nr:MAG: carbon starvation protein A [Candidatus Hydrogenedentota bacterium]
MAAGVLIGSGVFFLAAFFLYGKILRRVFSIDDKNPVPAQRMYDGIDFVPTRPVVVLGHHFSSIAGAGPIVGPIVAALAFGWAPALLWILLGAVFVGGVHDFGSLIASVRYRARSIPELCRTYISERSFRMFLVFIWLALVYVIVVFLDLTAKTFTKDAGVALSSFLILALAVLFGIGLMRAKVPFGLATGLALVGLAAAVGLGNSSSVVASVAGVLPLEKIYPFFGGTHGFWRIALLVYCLFASVLPVWLVLQPRDFLSSFLLYASLIGGVAGLLAGGGSISMSYPAFLGWTSTMTAAPGLLFPVLFITVACGACSGFHCVVASGTTSKQVEKESDTIRVGYGAMLLEGFLAVLSLLAAVTLGKAALTSAGQIRNPIAVYGDGMAVFLSKLGMSPELGRHLALLALSTFLLTTLDTCTRLARFVFEEFFAMDRAKKSTRWIATLASVIPPAIIVFLPFRDAAGKLIPAWKAIWPVFGATNQLLAALALLAVATWLRRTGRNFWIAALPMAFMTTMTLWALILIIRQYGAMSLLGGVGILLVLLAVLLVVEAFRAFGLGELDEAAVLAREGTVSFNPEGGRAC